jgi:AraC-like DNA-binding protein
MAPERLGGRGRWAETMQGGYQEFAPGGALEAMVECFWSQAVPAPAEPGNHRVLPDGCMDLLFDFRAEARPRVSIVGTMSRALVVESSGESDLIGIRFRPGGLPALLGLDAAALRDFDAEPGCFGDRSALELWERLAGVPAARRPVILRQSVRSVAVDPLVAWCANRIEASGGALSMAELEAASGAGSRQIERKFLRHVGISPKAFARIARFRRLLARVGVGTGTRAAQTRWADLAADCGYADQPHMVREFRAFAGITPTQYFASRTVGFVQDEVA